MFGLITTGEFHLAANYNNHGKLPLLSHSTALFYDAQDQGEARCPDGGLGLFQ